ncbi:hypothetical protein LOK49_LG05G02687 [Camellia lanceoleosa]|uniref:Uncharacterized protein n=1 Tax=Camellia lanceoleosa TaxID=1840588 RepID=A0ACC0HTT0_9ERIC|nr:hypothetical protein LOK49_LG05G02687 [Camellia lanceoleosa]
MLAVFDQSVAKSPEGLRSQSSVLESSALKDGLLIQDLYSSLHPNSFTINLGLPGFIAYSSHKQSPLLPRYKLLTHLQSLLLIFYCVFTYAYIHFFFLFHLYLYTCKYNIHT